MRRLALLLALLPAAAFAQKDASPYTVGYRCDDGHRILVEYQRAKAALGSERVVLTRGVKRWKMARQVSADGERYADDKQTMEWLSKGPSGTLTELGTKKAVGCREVAAPNKTGRK